MSDAVPGLNKVINLSACPMNAQNLTGTLVYYLTYGDWPALDKLNRPLFAYGKSIHDNCERRAHYDSGQYVEQWGDEAHREGHCGHGCIGCAEPDFWDKMTPFYAHLPGFPGFGKGSNIDKVGFWATIGVTTAFAGHTLLQLGRKRIHEGKPTPGEKSEGGEA